MRRKANIPEKEIACQIIEGRANKEIAEYLGKKKCTIDKYIHVLLRRHDCNNRTALAVKILGLCST